MKIIDRCFRKISAMKFAAKPLDHFRRFNLQKKIIWSSFLIFISVFLIYFSVFAGVLFYSDNRNTDENLVNVYEKTSADINHYFDSLDHIANSVRFSNWVQQLLRNNSLLAESEVQLINDNATQFLSNMNSVMSGNQFYIITLDGTCVNYSTSSYIKLDTDIASQPWYSELIQNKRYIDETVSNYAHTKNSNLSIYAYYPITSVSSFELIGYLLISIPKENLTFGINDMTTSNPIIITGEKKEQIAANVSDAEMGRLGINTKVPFEMGYSTYQNHRAYCNKIEKYGWTIRVLESEKMSFMSLLQEFLPMLFVVVPLGFLVVLLAIAFSKYLTRPIVKCKDALLKIRNNTLGVQIEDNYYDEIGDLLSGFNEMSAALVNLINQNILMDTIKRETEFQMLQQKINPHFLYNTLEIINGLILTQHNQQAVRVCETLGQMFRYNLLDKRFVAVREEYKYIREYLLIMEYKIEGLEVFWEADESVLDVSIPKMILQPFLENSIKHGFGEKINECCITVSVKDIENSAEIMIMDNGAGISPEQLESIKNDLQQVKFQKEPENSGHIGIRNIYHRLFLTYGSRFSFDLISKQNLGTKIIIRLPKERADKLDINYNKMK